MHWLRSHVFSLTPWRIAVLVGLLFTAAHALSNGRLQQLPVLSRIEQIFHDLKFHERGVRKPSGDVVIAAVDEKAIDLLGRWQFPRSDIATIVDKLTELGARAIVFDVAFTDAAFEGQFAGARKLQTRFEDISLASPQAAELTAQLAQARTGAAGALEAARSLDAGDGAARDVRQRLEPVQIALDSALRAMERYRALHGEYRTALAREVAQGSPDEQLARAVHDSGRVVLGSFLLTAGETSQIPADQLARARDLLRHMTVGEPRAMPLLEPHEELIERGDAIDGVPLRGFTGAKAPLPMLVEPADPQAPRTHVSFFNTVPDEDGVIRRQPLVMAIPGGDGSWLKVPSLDLGALLRYYDADPAQTRLWTSGDDSRLLETIAILPNSAGGLEGLPRMGDFKRIPVDERGQMLLNYYGPDGTIPNVSVADVWTGRVPRDRIDGKIVVFGVTAIGTHDQRVTPFETLSPGVEIHATAIENILHDDYLLRPWWATAVECLLLLVLALVCGRLFASVRVVVGLPVLFAAMAGYHLLDYALFRAGYQVFSSLPLVELGAIYVLQTVYRYGTEEREKAQIRRAFQFYLTRSVMEEMLKDPSKLKLGGDKKELTVLFSDIRGFTTISEQLSPEQLAKLLNEYLTPMTNVVFQHGGTLDKYIGDAVMAIWGAPVEQSDHALRCCRAAVAMLRALDRLQERWRMEGRDYPAIEIGIGINSGPMVVGNMGADQRFDYTVLGDNVNLASRLEGTNKDYRSQIIISEQTFRQVEGHVAARELGAVRVKGKNAPVRIYELLDDAPAKGELARVIGLFEAGVDAFRRQQWDEARAHFRRVRELRPGDGPSQAYLDFCDQYEAAPPGDGWDGVYTMSHK